LTTNLGGKACVLGRRTRSEEKNIPNYRVESWGQLDKAGGRNCDSRRLEKKGVVWKKKALGFLGITGDDRKKKAKH